MHIMHDMLAFPPCSFGLSSSCFFVTFPPCLFLFCTQQTGREKSASPGRTTFVHAAMQKENTTESFAQPSMYVVPAARKPVAQAQQTARLCTRVHGLLARTCLCACLVCCLGSWVVVVFLHLGAGCWASIVSWGFVVLCLFFLCLTGLFLALLVTCFSMQQKTRKDPEYDRNEKMKLPIGIPSNELVEVDADTPGAMVTPDGRFVIRKTK